MRWSSAIRVGLSGTSLALAMGCSNAEETPKREPESASETASEKPGKAQRDEREQADQQARDERAREDEARAKERERVSSNEPAPWFLRPAGDTTQASVQQNDEDRSIKSQPPEQPKPIVKQVQKNPPVQQVGQRPGGWRNRAACGRG